MLTIISPCCRQDNIKYLYDSINFDKIDKWIIVYDTSKNRKYNKLYENNSKIMEVECDDEGVTGHPQRNYGMSFVNDGYMYFLDDDNIIHPQFWPIVDLLDNEHFYTFDQIRDMNGSILHGNNISICNIDTAMFIIHKKHIKNIIWRPNEYAADAIFICDIKTNNKDAHKYINSKGCYYNYLKWSYEAHMGNINFNYDSLCYNRWNNASDIYEHLPTLYNYSKECESVFQTGVRGCISSWAFTKGLLENNKPVKSLFLNDISPCKIDELLRVTEDLPIDVKYKWVNNLQLDLPSKVDLTFIDTWHVYGQLKRELAKFSKLTLKYIIIHHTTVDGIHSQSIRLNSNLITQSMESGFPIQEIKCGLQKAIDEFLQTNNDWVLHKVYTNNNGLTILKRKV